MDKLYKIGQAAKLLGVSPSTLRRWEREGKISSHRTEGKHRLYRLSQFSISKTQQSIRDRKTIAYRKNQKLLDGMKGVIDDVTRT
jgi:putative resolvase